MFLDNVGYYQNQVKRIGDTPSGMSTFTMALIRGSIWKYDGYAPQVLQGLRQEEAAEGDEYYTLSGIILIILYYFIPVVVQCGEYLLYLYPIGYKSYYMTISEHIKAKRKEFGLTQVELSERAGVGLRFVRELERGKSTVQLDKVNMVLKLFGEELQPVKIDMTL